MNLDVNSLKGMLDNKDTKDALNGVLGNADVSKLLGELGQGKLDADSVKKMLSGENSENISKLLSNLNPDDIKKLSEKIGSTDSSAADCLKNIVGGFMNQNK